MTDRNHERVIAKQLFVCWKHDNSPEQRESCGACALKGYTSRHTLIDNDGKRLDRPNYAGWARVYVQAGIPIPKKWKKAFEEEASDQYDNQEYSQALREDIKYYGVTFR